MLKIVTTPTFDDWLENVSSKAAQLSIAARLTRLEAGDVHDLATVGQGIMYLHVDHGDGFHLYLTALRTPEGNGFTVLSGSNDGTKKASSVTEAAILATLFKD